MLGGGEVEGRASDTVQTDKDSSSPPETVAVDTIKAGSRPFHFGTAVSRLALSWAEIEGFYALGTNCCSRHAETIQ